MSCLQNYVANLHLKTLKLKFKGWTQVSKTRIACDDSLMWEKIHVEIEYLKLEFPILHIPQTDLFLLLLSRSDSSSSYPIWSSVLLPLLFFFFLLICSSIEIESYRLGFTFYKLESIRLKDLCGRKPPNQQVELESLRLKFILNSHQWNTRCYFTESFLTHAN